MNKSNNSKQPYERPWTEKLTIEVEGFCAGSTTSYENAGSAGNGEYHDDPFTQIGSNDMSGMNTEEFGGWTNY